MDLLGKSHPSAALVFVIPEIVARPRFFGIFGLYFSLQYLSIADAIVLTFLTPLCSAVVECVFLKEKFKVREGLAGS